LKKINKINTLSEVLIQANGTIGLRCKHLKFLNKLQPDRFLRLGASHFRYYRRVPKELRDVDERGEHVRRARAADPLRTS
jgi:hypothetical protein